MGILDELKRKVESEVQSRMGPAVQEMERLRKELEKLNKNVQKLNRLLERWLGAEQKGV